MLPIGCFIGDDAGCGIEVARARDNLIDALFRFNPSRIHLAKAKGEIEQLF